MKKEGEMNAGDGEREGVRTEIAFVEEGPPDIYSLRREKVHFHVAAEGEPEAGKRIKNVCVCSTVSVSVCVHLSPYVRRISIRLSVCVCVSASECVHGGPLG